MRAGRARPRISSRTSAHARRSASVQAPRPGIAASTRTISSSRDTAKTIVFHSVDAADLVFAGVARQAEMIGAGEVSPRELVDACLARIERLDPQLNAFRVVFAERARADADALGERDGRPLYGVPVAIKDDMDVAGEPTRFGTAIVMPPATADSELVRRLRAAGAVVIGKTNVPELTIWPFTESSAAGVTRNPWHLERTPGGSSGGTAAAVAAGLVSFGTGSDG